jgi:hypothetical protein
MSCSRSYSHPVQSITDGDDASRKFVMVALLVGASSLLGDCGLFGYGASATKGAAFGGCHAGTPFQT